MRGRLRIGKDKAEVQIAFCKRSWLWLYLSHSKLLRLPQILIVLSLLLPLPQSLATTMDEVPSASSFRFQDLPKEVR